MSRSPWGSGLPPQAPDENEWRPTPPARPSRNVRRHIILFSLTLFTTLVAGTVQSLGVIPFSVMLYNPSILLNGVPYAFSILSILTAHEMGHYILSRRHGVTTSLPFFIPSPLFAIPLNPGTFGAVIVTRSPYPDRRALMDIGAAGPIAGFIVAIPVLAWGISLSEVKVPEIDGGYITLGEPLLLKAMSYLIHGPLPDGYDIFIHPVAYAGWIGLLVTMINMIPIGQLDGGHILYALIGGSPSAQRVQRIVMILSFAAMGYLGLRWPGWYLWMVLNLIMAASFRFRHPAPINDFTPLDFRRKMIGLSCLVIFILSCIPVPFEVIIPEGIEV